MVQNIDLLVITGPGAEQIGALPALLERYTVGAALVTGLESGAPEWAALTARLTESGIPKAAVWAGYRVDFGDGAWIEIANPQRKPHPKADPGVHGMAIKAGYGDARFLIAGGLDEDGAAALLDSGRWLGATVLELPAGAWKAFGGEDFLAAVRPSAAVIEVVAGDSRTYPGAELVERLGDAPLFRTDHDGAVTFVTDGREMWAYPAR
jgi:competence protein ComEC